MTLLNSDVFSSPFQGTVVNKVQFATAHSQLYRSYKVTLTVYQTDLRISNPRGHKFPPSLKLLSFKTRMNDLQCWPQPQIFRAYFFKSCNIQGNVQAFQLTGLL